MIPLIEMCNHVECEGDESSCIDYDYKSQMASCYAQSNINMGDKVN